MVAPRTVLSALVYSPLIAVALAQSETCAPAPVAITIGNVTLSNNHVARGMELSIGTPAQSFAFLPQWPMNNTFVYGTDGHCTSDFSASRCTTFRGGSYDAFASSTRTVPGTDAYPVDSSPWTSVSFAADTIAFGTNSSNVTAVASFPVGVALNDFGQQGYHPMNAIGLGFNSTLLNTLKTTGQIASRTWSMFWGLNGATGSGQMDGVFVFGGYDAAKVVQSQKYTLPLASAASSCPSRMVLSITDVVLNFSNGTNASIFPGAASTALQACLTPDFPVLMTLPLTPYFQNIETLTNQSIDQRSNGIVFFANRYLPGAAVYTGDLTIKFQTGLTVRVPNDQLVVPDRYIDANGALQANASGPDTTILAIQNVNADDMMQLGRQLLSAAYVMVNQDAGVFTLWQANPTKSRQLVAVNESNADVTAVCSASRASVTSTSGSKNTTVAGGVSTDKPKSVSVGIVAGAAVGGCVAIAAVIGLIVFCCLRRRRHKRAAAAVATAVAAREIFDLRSTASSAVGLSSSDATSFNTSENKTWCLPHEIDSTTRIELTDGKDLYHTKTLHYELQG